MRCVSCNTRSKGKSLRDFDSSGGRCPACGHQFVADPPRDGFSDIAVGKALKRVSNADTVPFLPEHLGYELQRSVSRRFSRGGWLYVAGVVLIVVAFVFLAKKWVIAAGVAGVAGLFVLIAGAVHRRRPNVFSLAERYLLTNRPKSGVPPSDALLAAERAKALGGLGAAKRIVVCQTQRLADFLLANQFALKHACPVIGPGGALAELYPGLVERLARGPAPDVFVLHDFTPAGLDFARAIRELPRWLGRAEKERIYEVGLVAKHLRDLKRVLRPLGEIPGTRPMPSSALFRAGGTEISGVRPALLIAALGHSLEDKQPLRLRNPKDDDDGDSDDE